MEGATDLLEIVLQSERYSPRTNALSAFRLLEIGNYLGLSPGMAVIDCGCGHGEALCLWAKCFGVSGVGVDAFGPAIANATALAEQEGIAGEARFVHADMQKYDVGGRRFDVTACFGATMCFGGFGPAIPAMQGMVAPGGQVVIGQPYFTTDGVPDELREYEGDEPTETELFDTVRAAGCEVGYYSRASRDEWDRYIFNSNMRRDGTRELLHLLRTMPDGPAREEARLRARRWQDMYLRYRQKWQGMAFMTIHPV